MKLKLKAGDNITVQDANWSFSGKTPKNFDKHIKKSVPLYEWSHDVSKIFRFFSEKVISMILVALQAHF